MPVECGIVREQPPSGGCVLKLHFCGKFCGRILQPPSGGCVLKHHATDSFGERMGAAAFGRLCVETYKELFDTMNEGSAAAFGRLCVETDYH